MEEDEWRMNDDNNDDDQSIIITEVILIDSWQWLIESEWLIDGDLIVTLWPMK